MNRTIVISFTPDGNATCLWTDAIALAEIGELDVSRASTIEWSQDTYQWEVRLASSPDTVSFSHVSRAECLEWEVAYFNAHIADTLKHQ